MSTHNNGVLIIDLEGTSLSDEEKGLIQHPAVAGILFFARNYTDRHQLCNLVKEIRSIRSNLLLTVDQEGGRVQRFKKDFTLLPPAECYARYYNRDPEGALDLVKDSGWLMAQELLSCGIDLSLAPVLDINLGLTDVIGDRAMGNDPETVIALASAWVNGVHSAGMACVGKHFPGHGSVSNDSHLTLPVDTRSLDEIKSRDMEPFKALIDRGLQSVMPAHIVFSEVDDKPAGFSSIWLNDILRKQLGFKGVVMSDCLTMEAAASAGDYVQRTQNALNAGCDLLLLSNREGVKQVLPWLETQPLNKDCVSLLKPSKSINYIDLQTEILYQSCKDRLEYLFERYKSNPV